MYTPLWYSPEFPGRSQVWKTAIYNTYVIYESYIYHVDINYSTITSLHITPAIHSCQWTKQFPLLHRQPQSKRLVSACAHMTFNRDFSKEIKGEGAFLNSSTCNKWWCCDVSHIDLRHLGELSVLGKERNRLMGLTGRQIGWDIQQQGPRKYGGSRHFYCFNAF